MFRNWNLLRILTLAGGAALAVVGLFVPPIAAVAVPIGTGMIGLAMKAPGTMTATDLANHGEAVAAAVVPAVVEAAVGASGRSPAQIGSIVATAAKGALADTAASK
jgi:hypothetical protein